MSATLGVVVASNDSRSRARLALGAGAMLCAGLGFLTSGMHGAFIAGVAFGMVCMLLALYLASRWPVLSGGVPGLLGGMIAAVIGMGWQNVSSWGGLVGGMIAISAWVVIDREAPTPSAGEVRE